MEFYVDKVETIKRLMVSMDIKPPSGRAVELVVERLLLSKPRLGDEL
jgi:hypothetical protein